MDWGDTAQQALEALVAAGGAAPGVTLTRTTPGEYDPATSTTAAPTVLVTAGVGLVFPYSLQASGESRYGEGGALIVMGDQQLYLAALDAAGVAIADPKAGDACLAPDGFTYTVKTVKTLAPAGVALVHDVQLRR